MPKGGSPGPHRVRQTWLRRAAFCNTSDFNPAGTNRTGPSAFFTRERSVRGGMHQSDDDERRRQAPGGAQSRRALLVVNAKSRDGRDAAETAAGILRKGGIHLIQAECRNPAELSAAIRRLSGSVDLVVLGGGDGTMNAAASTLMETGLPLGILPLGTANDLARTLGIPLDLDGAAKVIVDGHVRRIDLGEVNDRPFFNVASIGLSVEVTRELTRETKRRWGRLGYAIATCRALWRMRPFSADISHGGQVNRVRAIQIAVGNGRHYGGGMTVEADAEIDDGYLNLYSIEFAQLWRLALIYPAFRAGRHGLWQEVRTATCDQVNIRTRRPRAVNTDGELSTHTPARFRILRNAVSVLAPERQTSMQAGNVVQGHKPQLAVEGP